MKNLAKLVKGFTLGTKGKWDKVTLLKHQPSVYSELESVDYFSIGLYNFTVTKDDKNICIECK